MYKIKICLLMIFLSIGCEEIVSEKVEKSKEGKIEETVNLEQHNEKYKNLKKEISKNRIELKRRTDINEAEKIELAEAYISKILIDSVFEYWSGTRWDFNGHTTTPRKGEIACGYYITTPLRDIGVKLNRIKLAQKASSEIIKKLCKSSSIKTFNKLEYLEKYLDTKENDEILIVGLDFHVGFIFKRNDKNYFAHSNYIGRKGVVKEKLETSRAINSSKIYVVGQLPKNKEFVKNWIKG